MFVKMAPLSSAEKCQHYREKNQEPYPQKGILRMKNIISLLRAKNLVANEARLKIQPDKKRLYRERKREKSGNVAAARVCLKYFVNDCLWKQYLAFNSPQNPSNLICLTIFVTLSPLTQC